MLQLIGYDRSPFVRRVAATLNLYGLPFEQLALRARDQGADIARYNPLGRVPALVLEEDGEILVDSAAILDHLDELVGPERALTPPRGGERRAVLRCMMFGTGAAEKAVMAFFERALRPAERVWPERAERLLEQVRGGLGALETVLATHGGEWLACGRMTQADVTATVALDYADAAIPDAAGERFPRLAALRDRVDALDAVGRTHFLPV
jgi:glutathione S-transferase